LSAGVLITEEILTEITNSDISLADGAVSIEQNAFYGGNYSGLCDC